MALSNIKALTFDTGGTILDWHSGFRDALQKVGAAHGLERNWADIANQLRRQSLAKMINLGEHEPPTYNFDGAHRSTLDELLQNHNLEVFDEAERHEIAYTAAHNFQCWPDFITALPKLREHYLCSSFTILSYRLIMDTARRNGLHWDAVFSCEGIGKYKMLPEAYTTVANHLQLEPSEICMVACHHFDLDAAARVGFKTAYVARSQEWGPAEPPNIPAKLPRDLEVNTFDELVNGLQN